MTPRLLPHIRQRLTQAFNAALLCGLVDYTMGAWNDGLSIEIEGIRIYLVDFEGTRFVALQYDGVVINRQPSLGKNSAWEEVFEASMRTIPDDINRSSSDQVPPEVKQKWITYE